MEIPFIPKIPKFSFPFKWNKKDSDEYVVTSKKISSFVKKDVKTQGEEQKVDLIDRVVDVILGKKKPVFESTNKDFDSPDLPLFSPKVEEALLDKKVEEKKSRAKKSAAKE